MEQWLKLSMLLCVFGLLKEFRPSEPFVTKYLTNPPMNFTTDEVSSQIYPAGTYATLGFLVFGFLITDLARYKPMIILDGLSAVVCYLLLIFCRSLPAMKFMEVFYGLFMALEVAYYTYIYAKVDKSHFQEVSSHTRAAYLIGRAISGSVSQIFISSQFLSYYELNFLTLGGMICATSWAFFLPPVQKSLYFHRNVQSSENYENSPTLKGIGNKIIHGIKLLLKDLFDAYSNSYVLKWSFWWALATCGYYQVLNYVQVLWEEIYEETGGTNINNNLNGAIELAYTLISALAAFACGKLKFNWALYGESVLCVGSLVIGAILYVMAKAGSIWLAYFTYVIYPVIYHSMITIANSEVACNINEDSYSLVFGINTFIAMSLQTCLTLVVNTSLGLLGRDQFQVYAVYFGIIGIIFGVMLLYNIILKRKKPSTNNLNGSISGIPLST